jgi:multicomponent K+:H+ antiporter subunit F
MIAIALTLAFGMMTLAVLLNLWRVVRGPTIPDRILALDTLYVNAVVLLILFGMYADSALYLEAALLIALLGFISTVALCKYLLRGDIIE